MRRPLAGPGDAAYDPAMASKKSVTAKTLEALGPARLAALLMDLAEADATVKRRLRGGRGLPA